LAIIIDGYNFLFADRRDMLQLVEGELEKMRNDFLGRLARLGAIENADITVVFDGGEGAESFAREFTYHGVTIIFSDKADTADMEIVKLLNRSHSVRDTVVVTDDRELRRNVKRAGAHPSSTDEFKRHMKDLFRQQRQAHREPLEKFEGVAKNEVDFWMQEFGIAEPERPPDGEQSPD